MAVAPQARFVGCRDYTGSIPFPDGTRLVRQNARLTAEIGGGVGHVYQHAGTGQWYLVKPLVRGTWRVCTYSGGGCPCGK
jgi:hypothetical protein